MKHVLLKLFAIVVTIWSISAFAGGEVRLLKAQSLESYYKGYWTWGRFEVDVANIAYEKQVALHIRQKNGQWIDYPLSYNRPSGSGREIWAADFNLVNRPSDADDLEFAVKYQVAGKTYWDNNNTANYRMKRDAGTILVGVPLYNGNFQSTVNLYGGTILYGYVTLKNIAYEKEVTIVYTTDNWKNVKTVKASFDPAFWNNSYSSVKNPNAYGFEEWRFQLNVAGAAEVEYAIAYKVGRDTYWDNNYGRNYRSTLVR